MDSQKRDGASPASPREKRGGSRGEETRAKLLDAAERLFSRNGYDGTSIGDVAVEAGIGVGTVYHHFADKRAVFLALLEDFPKRRAAKGTLLGKHGSMAAVFDAADKRAAIAAELWSAFQRWYQFPDVVMVAWNVARRDPEVELRCQAIQTYQVGVAARDIRLGQERGLVRPEIDPEAAALLLHDVYLCEMARLTRPPVPSEKEARRIVDTMADMLYRYVMIH